jgi:hypothetical protein
MKRIKWAGWLLAALLVLHNAGSGFAAPAANPLEGRLLQHTTGAVYLYHQGRKFQLEEADVGDAVIDAIPTASVEQWQNLFSSLGTLVPIGGPQPAPAGEYYPSPPGQPAPFPGYS